MELTKFDVIFTSSMALAVLMMGIVFPYVGLASGDRATASDVPTPDIGEWNVGASTFDKPDRPLGADADRIEVVEGGLRQLTIYADDPNITSIEVYGYSNLTDIVLTWENDTAIKTDSVSFYGNETGETVRLDIDNDYIVDVTLEEYTDNVSSPDPDVDGKDLYQIRVRQVEIAEQSSSGFFTWASNKAFDVGRTALWVGQVLLWGIDAAISFAINLAGVGFASAKWLVEITGWIALGYYAIISSAQSWVLALLLIPLIGLGIEGIKLLIIVIGVLPTT